MNIFRSVALLGVSTLLLSGYASNLQASQYGSVHQQAQQYQTQPRVIIVQPNRQISGQSSRSYGQQGQVQQYNYYPGLNYQQPRYHQQRPQPHQYPRYGQQPRHPGYNNHDPRRDRWSQPQRPGQQHYEQYQRPDYRAQQERYKAQREYERETRIRNRNQMLRNARPFQYQQAPQRNQHRNYGGSIHQQGPGRY